MSPVQFLWQRAHALKFPNVLLIVLLSVAILLASGSRAFARFEALDLVLDTKSKFSDGCMSIQNLGELAKSRKLDGLVISDHDRLSLEYGVAPFERLFTKKEERPSILTSGASTYLSEIRLNDENFENLVFLPGVESAPFYYWTGSPSDNNLVAHNWDKHLLIIGLSLGEEYEQIPTLNSNLSWRYFEKKQVPFFILTALAIACGVMYRKRKYPKLSALGGFIFVLLAFNNHPLVSSPFDQYHGDAGVAPYQEVIDYANSRGALVFWNHLESVTAMGKNTEGEMALETAPHPEDLLLTENYSGFQSVGDQPVNAAQPGKEWDQVLTQFVKGERGHPVWGIGTNDYHCDEQDGHKLGEARTIAWVRAKDSMSTLDALKAGRFYAVTQPDEASRLSLDLFTVSDRAAGLEATLGESLISSDYPEIDLLLSSTGGKEKAAQVRIIRNGRMVKTEQVSLPYRFTWRDLDVDRKQGAFYRVLVESGTQSRLVSNPVFVKFVKGASELAKAPLRPPMVPVAPKAPAAPVSPGFDDFETKPEPKAPAVTASLPTPAPAIPEIKTPQVAAPTVAEPSVPSIEEPGPAPAANFVQSKINGLSLKQKPVGNAPVIGKAKKGERLALLEKTSVLMNGKPWLKIQQGNVTAYVWEGFVRYE